MKRVVDVVLGTVLALVAVPFIVVAAVGSFVALRSWPFFVQYRVGRGGRVFRLVKVRTLPRETPAYACKSTVDIEIPRFARLLREHHIDELPQLFLVPVGSMSLVGPRPELPALHEVLTPAFADARTALRPGCTGLWQIGNHKHSVIGDAPEYDLYYLEHRTLRLDFWILVRSLRSLLPRAPLVGLEDIPAWTGAGGRGAHGVPSAVERRDLPTESYERALSGQPGRRP